MEIVLNTFGSHLGTRFAAAELRNKVVSQSDFSEKLIFDFSGVDSISDSFADEFFGKLSIELEDKEIWNNSVFKNASTFIISAIQKAVKNRSSKTVFA